MQSRTGINKLSPTYLLITASYIAIVAGGLSLLAKHSKPHWWMGVILALYTAIIIAVIKLF